MTEKKKIVSICSKRGKILISFSNSNIHNHMYFDDENFSANFKNAVLSVYHNTEIGVKYGPTEYESVSVKKSFLTLTKILIKSINLWSRNYLFKGKNKYIVDKPEFEISYGEIFVELKFTKGKYFINSFNPNFLKWLLVIAKSIKEYREVQLTVNTLTNEIIKIDYPPTITDYENPKWDNKIIRKWHRKSSGIKLPENNDLRRIDELLDFYGFVLVKYAKGAKWYFTYVNDWDAKDIAWRQSKSREEFDPTNYKFEEVFQQHCVEITDIKTSFKYLLECERYDIIKKLAPALIVDFENEEYISNPHNRYGADVEAFHEWGKREKPFYDLIPVEERYWLINERNLVTDFWDRTAKKEHPNLRQQKEFLKLYKNFNTENIDTFDAVIGKEVIYEYYAKKYLIVPCYNVGYYENEVNSENITKYINYSVFLFENVYQLITTLNHYEDLSHTSLKNDTATSHNNFKQNIDKGSLESYIEGLNYRVDSFAYTTHKIISENMHLFILNDKNLKEYNSEKEKFESNKDIMDFLESKRMDEKFIEAMIEEIT